MRRDLLARLARGPARVVDLASEHPISRPAISDQRSAISKHLRLLIEAGVVSAEDRGRERHYRLVPAGLTPVRDWLDGLETPAPRIPDTALDGLDLEVRRTTRARRTARQRRATGLDKTTTKDTG